MRTSVLALSRYSPTELGELAERAEALGFDSLWLADERFFRDAYASLAFCATRTRRLGLGVGVTDPYTRHPAMTAMAIATLDELSGGRAILGLGAGVSGLREMGIPQPKPARAIREAIEVVRALLRGEQVTYAGEVIRLDGARLDFTPPRPDLPIYVASNNRLGLRVAGELATGAIMQGCVADPTVRFFRDNVAAGRERTGRPAVEVDLVARINVSLADDRRAARAALKFGITISLIAQQPRWWSFATAGLEIPESLKQRVAGIPYTHDPAIVTPIAPHIPDAWVDALTIAGDPDHVLAEIRRLAASGITHFMLYPVPASGGPVEMVERFGREVLPRLDSL